MEMDYNLLENVFKLCVCGLQKSLKTYYGLLSLRKSLDICFLVLKEYFVCERRGTKRQQNICNSVPLINQHMACVRDELAADKRFFALL